MDVIATENLVKCYGDYPALRGIALRVASGSLFGFLGPNGAGKTTAIRILLGLLRASEGRATVLGHDVWHDGPLLRRKVGYLPGDVRFYDRLTGRATLGFVDAARGGGGGAEMQRLVDRLELDLDKRVRAYSRGMKQKLGLIAAMMHRPQLLILDEPTTGLDPLVRETLYEELRNVAAEGRTVLFSSHTLAEVEVLCDEVAIVREGALIEHERMDVLRRRAVRHVEVHFAPGAQPAQPMPAGLEVAQQTDRSLHGTWTGATDALVAWLAQSNVQDVTIAPPDLDDLFLAYYERPTAKVAP